MPGSSTNYGWPIPTNAGDNNAWGTELNTMIADVDAQVFTVQGVANGALPLAGSTPAANPMTGRLDAQTATMAMLNLGTISGGTLTLDCTSAQFFTFTVGANITTVTATLPSVHVPANYAFGIVMRVINGGSHTITWPGNWYWPGGTVPSLTVSGSDLLALVYDTVTNGFEMIGVQLNLQV